MKRTEGTFTVSLPKGFPLAVVDVFGRGTMGGKPVSRRLASWRTVEVEETAEPAVNERGEMVAATRKVLGFNGPGATLSGQVLTLSLPAPWPAAMWSGLRVILYGADGSDYTPDAIPVE